MDRRKGAARLSGWTGSGDRPARLGPPPFGPLLLAGIGDPHPLLTDPAQGLSPPTLFHSNNPMGPIYPYPLFCGRSWGRLGRYGVYKKSYVYCRGEYGSVRPGFLRFYFKVGVSWSVSGIGI